MQATNAAALMLLFTLYQGGYAAYAFYRLRHPVAAVEPESPAAFVPMLRTSTAVLEMHPDESLDEDGKRLDDGYANTNADADMDSQLSDNAGDPSCVVNAALDSAVDTDAPVAESSLAETVLAETVKVDEFEADAANQPTHTAASANDEKSESAETASEIRVS